MENQFPNSSFTSDTGPRTPPYTPSHVRDRLKRSDSPASIRSLHPTETVSPSKKSDHSAQDSVQVEELHEGDPGFTTDADLIYPEELEEPNTPNASGSGSSMSESDESDHEISNHFSRLDCGDGVDAQEANFERQRRAERVKRRRSSRLFKRTHSQSVQGDVEMTDSDAMADQDSPLSARRLRRRVRGSSGVKILFSTPPPSRDGPGGTGEDAAIRDYDSRDERHSGPLTPSNVDGMDVDDSE